MRVLLIDDDEDLRNLLSRYIRAQWADAAPVDFAPQPAAQWAGAPEPREPYEPLEPTEPYEPYATEESPEPHAPRASYAPLMKAWLPRAYIRRSTGTPACRSAAKPASG